MNQERGQDQDLWNGQVKPGMIVMSADGDRLGTVKKAREIDFWLDREAGPDLFIPYDEIKDITEKFITLNRTTDELEDAGWDKVPDTAIRPEPGEVKL